MQKTKKELMLEVGKLQVELTDIKAKIYGAMEMLSNDKPDAYYLLQKVYLNMSNKEKPLSFIKVEGHEVVMQAACSYNSISLHDFRYDSKKREYAYSRAFYCLLCLDLQLRNETELSVDCGRDRTMIWHYKQMPVGNVAFRREYEKFRAQFL